MYKHVVYVYVSYTAEYRKSKRKDYKVRRNLLNLLKITMAVLLLCSFFAGCAAQQSPAIPIAQNTQSGSIPTTPPQQPAPERILQFSKRQPLGLAGTTAQTYAAEQPKAYTIAWISDTQHYSSGAPDTFLAMTRYLKENREELNIGYVVHTGDIVSDGTSTRQWENAKRAMNELSGIPYGVLAGNHDVGSKINYKSFQKYFGEEQFSVEPYYGGSMLDNRNHYDLLTLGETEFVFVYLGYQPGDQSIAWANSVFQTYADRVGVLCVHDYINTDSSLRGMGKQLREQVVQPNPNVYMVLCGHRYTEDCLIDTFDDDGDGTPDRSVYQCIANYQNLDNGGNGYIRFMRIDEAKGTIRFYTYSPLLGKYRAIPEKAKNQKDVLPIPWVA